ncbi:MAG: hypothetical protein KatS3mg124_1432 [Porticoccaceae bacterium]|nr:MAG: hypothetical protein KatS3mg124_1432 [Porticoccaceae bacterium]
MELVPYEFAKRHGLFWDPPRARLCLRPDFDPAALGEIQRALGRAGPLETLAAEDFASRLEELYGAARGRTSSLLLEAEGSLDLDAAAARLEESGDLLAEDDAPVVRFLNAVIAEALRARASDVHIEPHRAAARIRYRIDGVLHTALTPPSPVGAPPRRAHQGDGRTRHLREAQSPGWPRARPARRARCRPARLHPAGQWR